MSGALVTTGRDLAAALARLGATPGVAAAVRGRAEDRADALRAELGPDAEVTTRQTGAAEFTVSTRRRSGGEA